MTSKIYQIAQDKRYLVDDHGNVIGPSGKTLKVWPTKTSPYLNFGVRISASKVAQVSVHRYVAFLKYGDELFTSECVRHVDGDKLNNSPENIVIGSVSDNFRDNPQAWRQEFARRGARTRRKLTDDQVREIKQGLGQGCSFRALAKRYNVAKTTIQQIKNGKSYTWIV